MEMGIGEFAKAKGLSRGRVLHLLHSGEIKGRKIGGRWILNSSELNHAPKVSRPFSPRMAQAFLEILNSGSASIPLDPAEKARLHKRMEIIKKHRDPALLLRSWIKDESAEVRLRVDESDLEKLKNEKELIPSGNSFEGSGLSRNNQFEAYIEKKLLKQFVKKHLLVESDNPNVILRVRNKPLNKKLINEIMLVDLARNYGSRERGIVKEAIAKK